MGRASDRSSAFIRTGLTIGEGRERLAPLYELARKLCAGLFPAEETRTLDALLEHVPIGWVDRLRRELTEKLILPAEALRRDRFSVHGCGPIGLHDDAFRVPHCYFIVIVAHSGRLGLIDQASRAAVHQVGEVILLDPRRKHGLVREGHTADEHVYERTHSPVHERDDQFMFLNFDVARADLQGRFRSRLIGAIRDFTRAAG
jgi:hypothetical protein